MKILPTLLVLAVLAAPAAAETIAVGPNMYQVTTGVEFTLGNAGLDDYLFNWTDSGGSFTDVSDPTLFLSAGQTYTFRRVTSAHPFVITDDTLPVSGTDGSFVRETTDGAVIDAATLSPLADFTADPAPTSDAITWSLTEPDLGIYHYTCRVTFHTGMTGRIEVVAAGTVANEAASWSGVKALYR